MILRIQMQSIGDRVVICSQDRKILRSILFNYEVQKCLAGRTHAFVNAEVGPDGVITIDPLPLDRPELDEEFETGRQEWVEREKHNWTFAKSV